MMMGEIVSGVSCWTFTWFFPSSSTHFHPLLLLLPFSPSFFPIPCCISHVVLVFPSRKEQSSRYEGVKRATTNNNDWPILTWKWKCEKNVFPCLHPTLTGRTGQSRGWACVRRLFRHCRSRGTSHSFFIVSSWILNPCIYSFTIRFVFPDQEVSPDACRSPWISTWILSWITSQAGETGVRCFAQGSDGFEKHGFYSFFFFFFFSTSSSSSCKQLQNQLGYSKKATHIHTFIACEKNAFGYKGAKKRIELEAKRKIYMSAGFYLHSYYFSHTQEEEYNEREISESSGCKRVKWMGWSNRSCTLSVRKFQPFVIQSEWRICLVSLERTAVNVLSDSQFNRQFIIQNPDSLSFLMFVYQHRLWWTDMMISSKSLSKSLIFLLTVFTHRECFIFPRV